jgi:hypothetical protein
MISTGLDKPASSSSDIEMSNASEQDKQNAGDQYLNSNLLI